MSAQTSAEELFNAKVALEAAKSEFKKAKSNLDLAKSQYDSKESDLKKLASSSNPKRSFIVGSAQEATVILKYKDEKDVEVDVFDVER